MVGYVFWADIAGLYALMRASMEDIAFVDCELGIPFSRHGRFSCSLSIPEKTGYCLRPWMRLM